jgi:hypothetical protein
MMNTIDSGKNMMLSSAGGGENGNAGAGGGGVYQSVATINVKVTNHNERTGSVVKSPKN